MLDIDKDAEFIERFRACKNDDERWRLVLENKDLGFLVNLDNDDTFITLDDEKYEEVTLNFDDYIGWSDGVLILLRVCGVMAESV